MKALQEVQIQVGVDENGLIASENRGSLLNETNEMTERANTDEWLPRKFGMKGPLRVVRH